MIFSPPSKLRRLFTNGALVGNGADLTVDTLHSFTLAAGQLANVGDTIRIKTGGPLGATTDSKSPRVSVGGTVVVSGAFALATNTSWVADVVVTKTGANTQSYVGTIITQASSSPKAQTGTLTLTDTNTIAILVTGQNTTSSVAGSVGAQLTTIDFN